MRSHKEKTDTQNNLLECMSCSIHMICSVKSTKESIFLSKNFKELSPDIHPQQNVKKKTA